MTYLKFPTNEEQEEIKIPQLCVAQPPEYLFLNKWVIVENTKDRIYHLIKNIMCY